jgi:hypothetical protein
MDIHFEMEETKGRAYADENKGEMTFSIAGNDLWIIDHTEVDESARGMGLGRKMLQVIIDKARDKNIKLLPLCPYAKSVFEKEPGLKDVLKQ